MQKAGRETVKSNNKTLILLNLRNRNLSRTELARITGLSNSTVSVLVSELIQSKIVFEKSFANSSGGRRQVILSVNPAAAYSILFLIIPGVLKISAVDLDLKVNCSKKFNYDNGNKKSLAEAVTRGISWIDSEHKNLLDKTVGIGISISGLVDHSNDRVLYSSLLNLKNIDVKSDIASKMKKNTYVFKDTDAMAAGGYVMNGLSADKSYLFILAESGFGISFMIDGHVLQLNRSGLELGHLRLKENGPKCKCGKYGCVEAFVSEEAALRELALLQQKSGKKEYDINKMSYFDIVSESNKQDGSCRQVLRYQAEYLGQAIAAGVSIFAPDAVILSGPVCTAEWDFRQIVRKSFSKNSIDIFSNTEIKFFNITEEASIIGMASDIFGREFFGV